MKTVFQFLALANAASPMQGRSMSLRDRLNCAQANYMILTGMSEDAYPELPEYTPWMMHTVHGDEVINSDSPHECRAGDMVIAGCNCYEMGNDFWDEFYEDQELCIFLREDAPEAFESEPHPGVNTFAELICEGWDDHEAAIGDDHHWDDDDHHWEMTIITGKMTIMIGIKIFILLAKTPWTPLEI